MQRALRRVSLVSLRRALFACPHSTISDGIAASTPPPPLNQYRFATTPIRSFSNETLSSDSPNPGAPLPDSTNSHNKRHEHFVRIGVLFAFLAGLFYYMHRERRRRKIGLCFDTQESYVRYIERENLWKKWGQLLSKRTPSKRSTVQPEDLPRWGSSGLARKISLYRGDICQFGADAVVNAAKYSLRGGGGVDGAIHRAAGWEELDEACIKVGSCPTGQTRVTLAFRLPSKFIFHTVGPRVGEDGEPSRHDNESLASCYRSCLDLVVSSQGQVRSIAFCSISTGGYGFPISRATDVALKTVKEFLSESEENLEKIDQIVFCVFSKRDFHVYENALSRYFSE